MRRSKEYYEKKLQRDGSLCEYEQLICPHCFEQNDAMALCLDDDGDSEEDVECEECGKAFDIKVKIEKTYTTTKAPEGEDG